MQAFLEILKDVLVDIAGSIGHAMDKRRKGKSPKKRTKTSFGEWVFIIAFVIFIYTVVHFLGKGIEYVFSKPSKKAKPQMHTDKNFPLRQSPEIKIICVHLWFLIN